MNLPLKFALRYLFARKSYNVINMISGIGVAGMAIGTAALIIILSVFNGFNALVDESLSEADAPLVIRPASGKVFVPEGPLFEKTLSDRRILRYAEVLEEQVFLSYEGKQSLARVKGMDPADLAASPLKGRLLDGEWDFGSGGRPLCAAGASLAYKLGAHPRFVSPIELHYPSRTRSVSLANPAASLRSVRVRLGSTFSVSADLDARLVLAPIGLMRELLEYGEEVTSIELWTAPEDVAAVQKSLSEAAGSTFRILNRYQQETSLYRMMRYEKLAIYLILILVVLIIAFNIYSSLKMLVIEKQGDMGTLRALGAPEGLLRRIFLLEGWLVSLVGMAIGLVLGITVVWLQERFGLVPMPGNFAVTAYPVVLKASDVLWTVAGVALIGYLMALIPSRKL